MHGSGLTVLIVLIVAAAVLLPLLERDGRAVPRVRSRPLLTDREVQFWRLLRRAAEPLQVAPQVAMGALLRVDHSGKGARAVRNRFDRKIVDFVLVGDDGSVRLLVELDDRMHNPDRDAGRDRLTARAGYRTLRVNGVMARDFYLLKAAVDGALGLPVEWSPPEFNPAGAPRTPRGRSGRPSSPPA